MILMVLAIIVPNNIKILIILAVLEQTLSILPITYKLLKRYIRIMRNMKDILINKMVEGFSGALGKVSIKISEESMGKCIINAFYEPKISMELICEKNYKYKYLLFRIKYDKITLEVVLC